MTLGITEATHVSSCFGLEDAFTQTAKQGSAANGKRVKGRKQGKTIILKPCS